MRYLRIEPGGDLKPYDGAKPFRAVVVIEEPVSDGWRWRVSQWLIEDEPLQEVFRFSKHRANVDVPIVETLIFHVSHVDREKEYAGPFEAA